MVKVDKSYTFDGPDGTTASLADLFAGKDQLIVYHFMFAPGDTRGCSGCSHVCESLPDVHHLLFKNTSLVCVSRAPVDDLEAYKRLAGWEFPWYSSGKSDFNLDFYATVDETVRPAMLNFRTREELEAVGKKPYSGDVPGLSVFCKNDKGDIFHTYSTFERGLEDVMSTLTLLDMTPLGRQLGENGPSEFKLRNEYDEITA